MHGRPPGVVVHVTVHQVLLGQVVHVPAHGDHGQAHVAGNVITGVALGVFLEVVLEEGEGLALQPLGHAAGSRWGRGGGEVEQDVVQLVLGELVGVVGVLVDGVPVVAEIFQGQLEALIAKGLDEVIGDPPGG